jgi:hypothetical protein
MPRAARFACFAVLVSLASACEEQPDDIALTDAAQPSCALTGASCLPPADAASARPDAQLPDAAAPADAGGALPPADAGHPGTSLDASLPALDAGASDATVSGGDAAATGDAQQTMPPADGGAHFPAVSDVGANGPYKPTTVAGSGPDGNYTLFHPAELGMNGVLHPIVAWGNGGFTTPDDYPQLPRLASHGFVVVASNSAFVGGAEVKAGLDWIVQQNDASSSPFYKKLDVRNVAGVGYSNGGLAISEVADDPRLVTLVIISGASVSEDIRTQNMPKIHTPTAYLCTDDDASKGNCAGDFAVITQPAFFGVMNGSTHTDVTTAFGVVGDPVVIDRLSKATTGWLRWRQMGDVSLKPMFVGADCLLCKDSNWTVQQKNLQ